jgi:hypothetical protein
MLYLIVRSMSPQLTGSEEYYWSGNGGGGGIGGVGGGIGGVGGGAGSHKPELFLV